MLNTDFGDSRVLAAVWEAAGMRLCADGAANRVAHRSDWFPHAVVRWPGLWKRGGGWVVGIEVAALYTISPHRNL